MALSDCKMLCLGRVLDARGELIFGEIGNELPFDVKRFYAISNVPKGAKRGLHAHKRLRQVMVAMVGSFDVVLRDGYKSTTFHLNDNSSGLYVAPGIWRELINFSRDGICLVLASDIYQVDDYIKTPDEFNLWAKSRD